MFLTLICFETKNNDQEISCVTYKIGRIRNNSNTTNLNSNEVKKHLLDMAQAFEQMEFKLFFTKKSSVFKIVDKLSASENDFAYKSALNRVKGSYYKNIETREKIKQIEFEDNLYNINVQFDEYKWIITNESKIISGYKCYKATCTFEEYDIRRKRNLVFNPEVWFAPGIPFSFGPRGLDGLPGLVLEGKFSNGLFYYATNISLSIKNSKINIEKPKKGIFIDPLKFQKIQFDIIEKQ